MSFSLTLIYGSVNIRGERGELYTKNCIYALYNGLYIYMYTGMKVTTSTTFDRTLLKCAKLYTHKRIIYSKNGRNRNMKQPKGVTTISMYSIALRRKNFKTSQLNN